jgi:hypothetical protein
VFGQDKEDEQSIRREINEVLVSVPPAALHSIACYLPTSNWEAACRGTRKVVAPQARRLGRQL